MSRGLFDDPKRPLVVCVDDERPILSAMQRLLRGEPYDLLTTDRPAEALEWARTREIALIIADYRMPEMNGINLLSAVRDQSPATRRVLLTGQLQDSIVCKARDLGTFSLLVKPWDNGHLKQTIREMVAAPDPGRAV